MAIQTTYVTQIDMLQGTAVSTAGAATINTQSGTITTEALATAAGATYTMTLTNASIKAASNVFASVGKGTATTGNPVITYVTPSAGSCVIIIQNVAGAAALNGTITISFTMFNVV